MKLRYLNLAEFNLKEYELTADNGSYITKCDSKFYFKELKDGKVTLYDSGFWELEVELPGFMDLNLGDKLTKSLPELVREAKISDIKRLVETTQRNLETISKYLKDLDEQD